jgi:hypothetical protein
MKNELNVPDIGYGAVFSKDGYLVFECEPKGEGRSVYTVPLGPVKDWNTLKESLIKKYPGRINGHETEILQKLSRKEI